MKTKDFLTSKKEQVIESYNKLTKEKFFNGITLKAFMITVMNVYLERHTSKKGDVTAKGERMLPYILGEIVFDNSKINSVDASTDALRNKYKGTSYMAMV